MSKYLVVGGLGLIILVFMSGCTSIFTNKSLSNKPQMHTLKSIAEIKNYISNADLVIFDIDNTLLEAKTYYCHANWFYDRYDEAIAQGMSEDRALSLLLPPWEKAQKNCEVKAVEPFIPELIKEIQRSGKKVMALTSRSQNIERETIAELSSLNIDFSKSAPVPADFSWPMNDTVVASKRGIVFTTDFQSKGDVLKEYLRRANFSPKEIVFVDDSPRNLLSVLTVQGAEEIVVHALLYPLVKRSPPHWDKELAKREWDKHLEK